MPSWSTVSCRGFAAAVASCFVLADMESSAGPERLGSRLWSSALFLLLLTGSVGAVSEAGKWIVNVDSVSFLIVAGSRRADTLKTHRVLCACVSAFLFAWSVKWLTGYYKPDKIAVIADRKHDWVARPAASDTCKYR